MVQGWAAVGVKASSVEEGPPLSWPGKPLLKSVLVRVQEAKDTLWPGICRMGRFWWGGLGSSQHVDMHMAATDSAGPSRTPFSRLNS